MWYEEPPNCELVFETGNRYPVQVIVTIHETNELEERRLVESKILTVLQPSISE
jgi:hypothetical protein